MKKIYVVICASCLLFTGCTKAEYSQLTGFGKDYNISVYSGGQKVKEFISSGKVLTEKESDGWFFMDRETGKLVRISGTVIVEER